MRGRRVARMSPRCWTGIRGTRIKSQCLTYIHTYGHTDVGVGNTRTYISWLFLPRGPRSNDSPARMSTFGCQGLAAEPRSLAQGARLLGEVVEPRVEAGNTQDGPGTSWVARK